MTGRILKYYVSRQWAQPLRRSNSNLSKFCFLLITLNSSFPYSVSVSLSDSNTNAKKWETELQTLRENNARLVDALQESSANVESWKKQLSACKEESDTLREKVIQAHTPAGKLNNVRKPINPAGRKEGCLEIASPLL